MSTSDSLWYGHGFLPHDLALQQLLLNIIKGGSTVVPGLTSGPVLGESIYIPPSGGVSGGGASAGGSGNSGTYSTVLTGTSGDNGTYASSGVSVSSPAGTGPYTSTTPTGHLAWEVGGVFDEGVYAVGVSPVTPGSMTTFE